MVEVNWTESALLDLEGIAEYISRDSIRYAEITVSRLFESVDILEDFPESGSIVPEFKNQKIRQLIRGSYRIIYFVSNPSRVDVLTIHHSARLLPDLKGLIE